MMEKFSIQSKEKKEIIDLTQLINDKIAKNNIDSGWGELFVLHTTCCITTADLDPGTDKDYLKAIDKIFPEANYQHPHDPDHVGDHIMSSIIGPYLKFPIQQGKALLGTWQKIVLIELNGPRDRQLLIEFQTK